MRLDKRAPGMRRSTFCIASEKSIHPRVRLRGVPIKDALAKMNANTRKASREAPVKAIFALPGCKPHNTEIRMRVFLCSVSPQKARKSNHTPCLIGSKGAEIVVCRGIKYAGAKGDQEQGTRQRFRRNLSMYFAERLSRHRQRYDKRKMYVLGAWT